ncbi:uncharacterized protein METZ01_LOCUS209620, partial [marine metagenome]
SLPLFLLGLACVVALAANKPAVATLVVFNKSRRLMGF